MCIACEMAFWMAMEDGPPPSTGVASHDKAQADAAPRFACEAPADEAPKPAAKPITDERQP